MTNCLCQSLVSLIVSFLFVPDPHNFPFWREKEKWTEIQSSGNNGIFKHSSVFSLLLFSVSGKGLNGRWYINFVSAEMDWTRIQTVFQRCCPYSSCQTVYRLQGILKDDFDWHNHVLIEVYAVMFYLSLWLPRWLIRVSELQWIQTTKSIKSRRWNKESSLFLHKRGRETLPTRGSWVMGWSEWMNEWMNEWILSPGDPSS